MLHLLPCSSHSDGNPELAVRDHARSSRKPSLEGNCSLLIVAARITRSLPFSILNFGGRLQAEESRLQTEPET